MSGKTPLSYCIQHKNFEGINAILDYMINEDKELILKINFDELVELIEIAPFKLIDFLKEIV
jgi:hypothetical protein